MEQDSFFFDKEAFGAPREAAGDAAQGAARAGAGGVRPGRADPGGQGGARLDHPDWQILLKLKTDGFLLAAPRRAAHAGPGAVLARSASAPRSRWSDSTTPSGPRRRCSRCRATWASTRRSSATWWASPSRGIAIGPLEEMLGQPGCPNLDLVLTNLPVPMVSLRTQAPKASAARSSWPSSATWMTPWAPMNPAADREVRGSHRTMLLADSDSRPSRRRACGDGWTRGPRTRRRLPAARGRLVQRRPARRNGSPRFPAEQVLLLDERGASPRSGATTT